MSEEVQEHTRGSVFAATEKGAVAIQFDGLSAREHPVLVRLLRASDLERATGFLRPLRYHVSLSEAASRIADVTASDAH
jgi:hypothetical protein